MEETPTKEEIDGWFDAVDGIWGSAEDEPGDMRLAGEAMANVWSGSGYQPSPTEAWHMLERATEIGYLIALRDLREGDLDDIIRSSRLDDLAEE